MQPQDAIDFHGLLSRPRDRSHRNPLQWRHRNHYAGPCGWCGHWLPVGYGTVAVVKGRYRVVHLDDECVAAETVLPEPRG